MVSHRCTTVVADKVVLLVIPCSVQVPLGWVGKIADGSQDHVVTFLDSTVPDVLHCLNEGQSSAVSFASLVLKVHVERRLVVDVIPGPELHAADPSDGVLRKTSVNPGLVSEKFRSAVFVEVTVAEHGGMSVKVTDT